MNLRSRFASSAAPRHLRSYRASRSSRSSASMPCFTNSGRYLRVTRAHVRVGHFLAERFQPQRVHEQARRGIAVTRVLLDQSARGHDERLAQFLHRHAVVEVALQSVEYRLGAYVPAKALARAFDERRDARQVERQAGSVLGDVDRRRRLRSRPAAAPGAASPAPWPARRDRARRRARCCARPPA